MISEGLELNFNFNLIMLG